MEGGTENNKHHRFCHGSVYLEGMDRGGRWEGWQMEQEERSEGNWSICNINEKTLKKSSNVSKQPLSVCSHLPTVYPGL